MGLFQSLFGRQPKSRPREESIWRTLTGYAPAFTSWGGQLYESELIRASIDAIARSVSKLEVTFQGTAMPKLKAAMHTGPNSFQTWGQFLYRLCTILYVKNTAFIAPVEDEVGSLRGYASILPNQVETVQDTGGNPWLRFRFESGESTALRLDEVGIITRYQYRHDLFGEDNRALDPTMNLIAMQEQGIPEAIKNSATFRFMARLSNFSKPEDLRKERDRFNREQLGSGSGGLLLFPSTYGEIKQIDAKPYTVDAEQMKLIQDNVYTYFGVNADVLQNKAIGDSWSAFYEGCVEPFAIQVSDVMSRMTYTSRERATGNGVFLTSNRLQYMSNADKLKVSAQMADRGLMSVNEIRAIWNLPPLEGSAGERVPIRGEYYDARQPGEPGGEGEEHGQGNA